MKVPEVSFCAWQQEFSASYDCLKSLQQMKWPNGFICSSYGNEHSYEIARRHLYECRQCKKQTTVTAGIFFHGSFITLI